MTVALVTGGGTGIGRALAAALVARGDRVVIMGRRGEVLEEAVRQIHTNGGRGEIAAEQGDVSNPEHLRRVISATEQRWGTLQLLINNAAVNTHHTFSDTTPDELKDSFLINCVSAAVAVQAALPGMRRAGEGAIVNISSILGKWGSRGSVAYSVSKYALSGLTDVLRQELIATPIHVLGVYPGYIQTTMTAPFVEKGSMAEKSGKTPEQLAQAILKALDRKKTNLYYPWYVPWLLRLHRAAPRLADRLARRVRR